MGHPKSIGVPLSVARSLHVVARFAGQRRVALDTHWPLLLDGLLAGVERRRRPPAKPNDTAVLPLARYTRDVGAQWSWMASIGAPIGHDDPAWAYRWHELELGVLAIECAGIEWWAHGDADGVRDLLDGIRRVGNRDAAADVARWDVVDCGPTVLDEAVWLPSGYIARPVAARGAASLGVPDADTVDGAVRPPYWRAPTITEGGRLVREWRPVLAPWTRRPS